MLQRIVKLCRDKNWTGVISYESNSFHYYMHLRATILKIFRLSLLLYIIIVGGSKNIYSQQRDSMFLYNGQVLIGKILSGRFGEIVIDDRDLNNIEVKAYKIKKLSTTREFRIETNSKEKHVGIIQASEKPGWVEILTENNIRIPIEIINLDEIIPLEKKFLERLQGNLAAGFSYTKSSTIGQLNLSSEVKYATPLFEYYLSVSMNGSIDSIDYSRDREDISLFVLYSLSPTWFLTAGANYQRNLELSIARRYQELIGGGNKLFIRQHWQLLALSGLTFNQEKSTGGESQGLLIEIPLIIRFNFFKYRHPNLQVSSVQTMSLSLSQKGRFRYANTTSFSWELFKDFRLNINPYLNFDNQPPDASSQTDYGISIGLTFEF